jgi:pilus assembly protein Flp/PilA
MQLTIWWLRSKCWQMRCIIDETEGQDLIEYALVAALIGFAAVAGMGTLATDINAAFTNIGSTLTATA